MRDEETGQCFGCPYCGGELLDSQRYDKKACSNPDCKFNAIPLNIIDDVRNLQIDLEKHIGGNHGGK